MSDLFPRGSTELLKTVNCEGEPATVVMSASKGKAGATEIFVTSMEELKGALTSLADSAVTLKVAKDFLGTSTITLDGKSLPVNCFASIRIESRIGQGEVVLKNVSAASISNAVNPIELKKVNVLLLSLNQARNRAEMFNCNIGCLQLDTAPSSSPSFRISNSSILTVKIAANFAAHEVMFKSGSTIETRSETGTISEASRSLLKSNHCVLSRSSLGALYEWANKHGDARLAHLARSAELGIERNLSEGADRFFLTCWGLFSDYGLSAIKPLRWMVAASIFFSLLVFYTGASVGDGVVHSGWRQILGDFSDMRGQWSRSIVCSFEGIVSPLSVFSARRLIVPDQQWVAVVQVIYNYFCLSMVFLFGFSVRRRFKVS